MQISPIKIKILRKPSRNPSNRTKVKILKKIFWISLKKIGSAYAQSQRKCSNIKILAKIEGKEAKFCKKNSKLSHACVPLKGPKREIFVAGIFT